MIAPFLATLNIALQVSKSPEGGIAYLALTVRNADLLNSFLLALRGSKVLRLHLLINQLMFRCSADHNLSAEELPHFDRDCSFSFSEQFEGVNQPVRIFKVILHSFMCTLQYVTLSQPTN